MVDHAVIETVAELTIAGIFVITYQADASRDGFVDKFYDRRRTEAARLAENSQMPVGNASLIQRNAAIETAVSICAPTSFAPQDQALAADDAKLSQAGG